MIKLDTYCGTIRPFFWFYCHANSVLHSTTPACIMKRHLQSQAQSKSKPNFFAGAQLGNADDKQSGAVSLISTPLQKILRQKPGASLSTTNFRKKQLARSLSACSTLVLLQCGAIVGNSRSSHGTHAAVSRSTLQFDSSMRYARAFQPHG